MALPKWLQILLSIGPEVLAFTPLAPIAAPVSAAIALAESMPGKTGPQKLQQVVDISNEAATAINAQAGKQVVDPAVISAAAAQTINSVVAIVNSVNTSTPATPATATNIPTATI